MSGLTESDILVNRRAYSGAYSGVDRVSVRAYIGVDRASVRAYIGVYTSLFEVYQSLQISRQTAYKRMNLLQIKPGKQGNCYYLDSTQISHMKGLNEYYKKPGTFDRKILAFKILAFKKGEIPLNF